MGNLVLGIVVLLLTQALSLGLTTTAGFGWAIGLNVLVTIGLLKFALPDRVWALALVVLSLFSVPSSWIARDALPIVLGNTVQASIDQMGQLTAKDTIIHLKDGKVATDFSGTNVAQAKQENRDITVVTTVAPLVSEAWTKEQPVELWVMTTGTTLDWKKPHRKLVRLAQDWAAEAAAKEAAQEHGLNLIEEPRFFYWTEDPSEWVNDKLQLLGLLSLGPLVVWLVMFAMGLGRGSE